ncbi:MAG: hypothetical protein U5K27_19420 [Desulfotignum sp.]|nr:hypothetical protein [Desulfotignum sp.]
MFRRILVEFVKTPQAAYPGAFWLNTGQMLSIFFVVAGMVFLVKAQWKTPGNTLV